MTDLHEMITMRPVDRVAVDMHKTRMLAEIGAADDIANRLEH